MAMKQLNVKTPIDTLMFSIRAAEGDMGEVHLSEPYRTKNSKWYERRRM